MWVEIVQFSRRSDILKLGFYLKRYLKAIKLCTVERRAIKVILRKYRFNYSEMCLIKTIIIVETYEIEVSETSCTKLN